LRRLLDIPWLARWAGRVVAAALTLYLGLNTYWGFGGKWAVADVLAAGEIVPPLWVVWLLEAVVAAAIVAVLARSGTLRLPVPRRVLHAAVWLLAGWLAVMAMSWFSSPVAWEKYVIGPIAILLAALTWSVASAPDEPPTR